MKQLFLFISSVLLLNTPLYADTIDLFIMAGQSNMQGWRSDAAHYPPDPAHIDQQIPFYYKAVGYGSTQLKWEVLEPQQGHFPAGHFGPEVTFARTAFHFGYHPAIFKYSSGGSSLKSDWKTAGQHGQYDDMVKHLKFAIHNMEAQGHHVIPRAIIWIQGESDAEDAQLAHDYYWRLKNMLNHLRRVVLRHPHLPVVLSVDEMHPQVQQHPEVVKAQQQLAREDHSIRFFSMRGLQKYDVTHLTAKGTILQGKRAYYAFQQIVAGH